MPRVLIADKLDAGGFDILAAAGLEIDNRPGLKGDALREALRTADGCIVRSKPDITAGELESPGKLRAIARAGVGVDNIDVAAATRKGVVVMNTPGGNTVSAAEHTIALLFAVARLVPAADAVMKAGGWDRNKFLGTEVAGKTLGIIGLGRIGREVARRAIGLDMKVVGYDPLLSPDRANQLGIEAIANVAELLPRCDFLTIHTPLSDATKSLVGSAELATMKKTARILNVARGGIVDEAALAEALHAGRIAGAGIDVFSTEPPPADHPLRKAPNVVLTPHLGASTAEAQENVSREAAQLMVDFLTRGVISCAVNMAALDRTVVDELGPYIDLGRRLGLLHAQMDHGSIRKAELTFQGEQAAKGQRHITAAFAAGLLEHRLSEPVNAVNAELLARERGIELVSSVISKPGDFGSLIRAEVTTERKTYTAAATLFGNQYLRLVQVGPYRLDTYLDGTLLIFTHRDVPGLIGFIGTIFGKHGVNIAQMTVGRQQPGGEAIAVLNLDSEPPEAALAEVRGHGQISSLCVVKLPAAGEMPDWFG